MSTIQLLTLALLFFISVFYLAFKKKNIDSFLAQDKRKRRFKILWLIACAAIIILLTRLL